MERKREEGFGVVGVVHGVRVFEEVCVAYFSDIFLRSG